MGSRSITPRRPALEAFEAVKHNATQGHARGYAFSSFPWFGGLLCRQVDEGHVEVNREIR
jgi:hypothetical protein